MARILSAKFIHLLVSLVLLSDYRTAPSAGLLVAIGEPSSVGDPLRSAERETKAAIASPIVQIVSSKEPTARKSTGAVSSYVPSLLTLSQPFRGQSGTRSALAPRAGAHRTKKVTVWDHIGHRDLGG